MWIRRFTFLFFLVVGILSGKLFAEESLLLNPLIQNLPSFNQKLEDSAPKPIFESTWVYSISGPLILRSEVHKRFEMALRERPPLIPPALLKERKYKVVPLFRGGGGGLRFNMVF